MPDRLKARFDRCKAENRAALVTFTMAGDPDPAASLDILQALPAAGADIVELGMPFSDPLADGPSVQEAGLRALKNHIPLSKTLDIVREFRQADPDTPLILMGYYNPIYIYGPEKFVHDALAAGADGVIIVDLPTEMDSELTKGALDKGLKPIRLVTPTSDDQRLDTILPNTDGFLYYVSIKGVTGAKLAQFDEVQSSVERIRRKTDLPIAVGFGIKSVEDIKTVGAFADAAVVGSRLVDAIKDSLTADGAMGPETIQNVSKLVAELAKGVRAAREGQAG